jgi:hypothetical protein
MVLGRVLLGLLLVLGGCIKPRVPVSAPSAVDVASAVSVRTVDRVHGQAAPPQLQAMLTELLAERRLNLQPQDAAAFSARRSTEQRLSWLASQASGAPIVLLIELNVRRFDNLGGRFRWVIDVQLSIAPQAEPSRVQDSHFSVPVHLSHAHQGATEAVLASLPTLRRRLSVALDTYLVGAGAP